MTTQRRWVDRLPFAATMHQTREVWSEFDERQKRFALAASTVTFGRLGLRLALERANDADTVSPKQAMLLGGAVDLADNIDGRIARAGDAVTPLGKVGDPFADKLDFAIQEIFRAAREEISYQEVGIRLARDIASTWIRFLETKRVESGETSVSHAGATWAGKLSSFARALSLRISDVAPHSREAAIARKVATGLLVGSLAVNAYNYLRNPPEID